MNYTSQLLSEYSNIIHGVSTRRYHNLSLKSDSNNEKTSSFLKELGAMSENLKRMRQVHGNRIASVRKNTERIAEDADGMITDERGVILSVQTADCLPISIFDPRNNRVSVLHAGYKGILKHIVEQGVTSFISRGSNPKDMVTTIGPSIGKCCYNVGRERIDLFKAEFPTMKKIFEERNGELYLDLKNITFQILLGMGVLEQNIEVMPYCTSCNNDIFFSYRKDSKETYGEILTVIGLK